IPSRNATGAECAAMNSPTIFDHASITSVSCKRSRSPKRCINFGITSAGDCQRSGRIFLSGTPRHSAITAERREGDIGVECYKKLKRLQRLKVESRGGDSRHYCDVTLQRCNFFNQSLTLRVNISAACGLGEYLVRRGTWPRCAARSECHVRRESPPSRDRSMARRHSRASRGRESPLSR